jgi:hypothetical protein
MLRGIGYHIDRKLTDINLGIFLFKPFSYQLLNFIGTKQYFYFTHGKTEADTSYVYWQIFRQVLLEDRF